MGEKSERRLQITRSYWAHVGLASTNGQLTHYCRWQSSPPPCDNRSVMVGRSWSSGRACSCPSVHPGALTAYHAGMKGLKELVKKNATPLQCHRDLMISHTKIGDVLLSLRVTRGAFSAYERSLSIATTLVKRNPANRQWQRDLLVCNVKMAEVNSGQGNQTAALSWFSNAMRLAESQANLDPTNFQVLLDIAMIISKMRAINYCSIKVDGSILYRMNRCSCIYGRNDFSQSFDQDPEDIDEES